MFARLHVDGALYRSVRFQYANLRVAEFRPRHCIIDRALFCTIASPVRLNARTLVTLPAASIRSNLDNRRALLHGISWLWHDAVNKILEIVADKLSAAGLTLVPRR